jgi:membrane protein
MWQAVRYGYTWFLRSGLSNYGLVYGSLASVVILMLWVYLSGLSIYLGASFGVALERRLRSSD